MGSQPKPNYRQAPMTPPTPQAYHDERDTLVDVLPKTAEYLIAIVRGPKRVQREIWDGSEPFELDHPLTHWLARAGDRIELHSTLSPEPLFSLTQSQIEAGAQFEIPGTRTPVRLTRLVRSRAAFMGSPDARKQAHLGGVTELFVARGQFDYLEEFASLGTGYTGFADQSRAFRLGRRREGATLTAREQPLVLTIKGRAPVTVAPGAKIDLNEEDLYSLLIQQGKYWWRLNRVANPPVPAIEQGVELPDPEARLFRRLCHGAGIAFIALFLTFYFNPLPIEISLSPPKPKPLEPPLVELKKPKVINKPEEKKPEEKKPEIKKPEPPKPVIKKPEPPKPVPKKPTPKPVVKKTPPAPAPKPKAQIVKPLAPTPKPKAPPVLKPTPKAPPVPVATAIKAPPPPVTPPKPAVVQPTPEQIRAQQQAKLAQSLGFLSAAPNKLSKNPAPFVNEANPNAKYQAVTSAAPVAGKANNNMLTTLAGAPTSGGPVDTKSSRIVSGDTGVVGGYGPGGKGKGLNDVQGKVSLSALYDPNSGAGMGSALGGQGGLTMSGQGQIDESAILKALQKFSDRFNYCHQKAMLTEGPIAGTLLMRWTIGPGGRAAGPKVVNAPATSAKAKGILTECFGSTILKVGFPSPKGGAVTITFPFKLEPDIM